MIDCNNAWWKPEINIAYACTHLFTYLSSLNKVLSGKINCDYVLENLKLIFFNMFDISTDVLNSLIINTSKKKKKRCPAVFYCRGECTNPRFQVTQETELFLWLHLIFVGAQYGNLHHVTLLAPGTLRKLLDFWKFVHSLFNEFPLILVLGTSCTFETDMW